MDPRYAAASDCRKTTDVEFCKFDPKADPAFPCDGTADTKRFDSARMDIGRKDDALALECAKAISSINKGLVLGNHIDDPAEVVHYCKEGGTPNAYSLGDWGPVEIKSNGPGARPGAPVFTIETKDDNESWAFLDGIQVMTEDGDVMVQQAPLPKRASNPKGRGDRPAKFNTGRSKELQVYAQGIIDIILDLEKV